MSHFLVVNYDLGKAIKLKDTDTNETILLKFPHIHLLHKIIAHPTPAKYRHLIETQPSTKGEGSWAFEPWSTGLRLYDDKRAALNLWSEEDLEWIYHFLVMFHSASCPGKTP